MRSLWALLLAAGCAAPAVPPPPSLDEMRRNEDIRGVVKFLRACETEDAERVLGLATMNSGEVDRAIVGALRRMKGADAALERVVRERLLSDPEAAAEAAVELGRRRRGLALLESIALEEAPNDNDVYARALRPGATTGLALGDARKYLPEFERRILATHPADTRAFQRWTRPLKEALKEGLDLSPLYPTLWQLFSRCDDTRARLELADTLSSALVAKDAPELRARLVAALRGMYGEYDYWDRSIGAMLDRLEKRG